MNGNKNGPWLFYNSSTWKDKNGSNIDSLIETRYYLSGKIVSKDSYFGNQDTTGRKGAEYPGGAKGWKNYLIKNLNFSIAELVPNYPLLKSESKALSIVSFSILKDGHIEDIYIFRSAGYPFDNEVMRIVKRGGNWIPVQQGGQNVVFYQKQSITFAYSIR